MELPETKFDDLLAVRAYLIVCYRAGEPCTYQIYDGAIIAGQNRDYFTDSQDHAGNALTYKFFLLPKTVR